MYKLTLLVWVAFFIRFADANDVSQGKQRKPASEKVNILLIIADDMGFSDLQSFGGEVPTPNLDAIANSRIKLTRFITAPACSPSRAMLYTGVDHHLSGLGNMAEELSPNQTGKPGYEGSLNDKVKTIAEYLDEAGYHTYLSGKWHLGKGIKQRPYHRGFDKTFSLLTGGASHYADMKPAYASKPDIKAAYSENGKLLTALPKEFVTSTQFYADKLIEYFQADKDSDQPFFAVLSYTAPHWPLQAPSDAIKKYQGKYDDGYETLYQKRFAAQKRLGLIPENTDESSIFPQGKRWETLSESEKKVSIRTMEIYAAMIDELDQHTGRVLNSLKSINKFDNTLIIFISDNGAEGHTLDETWPSEQFPEIRQTIDSVNDFSYENMGKVDSYTLLGPNWARAISPGFARFKGYPQLGGINALAFIKRPNTNDGGMIDSQLASIKDLAPTILTYANVREQKSESFYPMTGLSLVSSLGKGSPQTESKDRVLVSELFGKKSVIKGKWQALHLPPPFSDGKWQLFDISQDSTNRHNLAEKEPAALEGLVAEWKQYERENSVILPDWVSGY